ncbi:hypothetical protein COB87_002915 [Candidatus Wolfebacteria bacterium]|nr:hypothetical protein [Candidatus Wolfebacteria bacterium]
MKTILVDAVHTFVIEGDEGVFGPFGKMHKMLEDFPNRKIILTSANDEQFKKFDLGNMPYEVFTLKHSPEKTDPEYYKKMLEHFALKAEDVVYFEHGVKAIESAKSVNIKTHYWDSESKPLRELVVFLENNT